MNIELGFFVILQTIIFLFRRYFNENLIKVNAKKKIDQETSWQSGYGPRKGINKIYYQLERFFILINNQIYNIWKL